MCDYDSGTRTGWLWEQKCGFRKRRKADLPKFRIGAIPDQDTAELQKGNDAVAAYLSDYLGFDVEFVPTVDYASLVEGFQRGDIQLAWFGGLTYVQTRNIVSDCTPLIQRPVDQSFQSVFIKNTELAGNVNSISDLKGKNIYIWFRKFYFRTSDAKIFYGARRPECQQRY